jgi:hypothetical protein
VAGDDEYAAELVKIQNESSGPYAIPMSSYTPEVEALASVVETLQSLLAVTIQANSKAGSTPPKFNPFPRPRTALQRARARARKVNHETLAARLLPHKAAVGG